MQDGDTCLCSSETNGSVFVTINLNVPGVWEEEIFSLDISTIFKWCYSFCVLCCSNVLACSIHPTFVNCSRLR